MTMTAPTTPPTAAPDVLRALANPTVTPALGVAARTLGAVKTYGAGDTRVTALDAVDVSFVRGRFTAIMGPSGSGKSTLLHCVAGLDSLDAGRVFIGDTELGSLSDKKLTLLRRDRVGFVFQAFNLVPTLTARENIVLPLTLAGRKPDEAWVAQVIRTVGLETRLRHRPSELSGGSSSASPWRAPSRRGPRSSSRTSPPATSTRAAGARSCRSCARPWTSSGRPS